MRQSSGQDVPSDIKTADILQIIPTDAEFTPMLLLRLERNPAERERCESSKIESCAR